MTRSVTYLELCPEDAALPEHRIDQGRLPVVNVGNDREVSNVVALEPLHGRSPAPPTGASFPAYLPCCTVSAGCAGTGGFESNSMVQ